MCIPSQKYHDKNIKIWLHPFPLTHLLRLAAVLHIIRGEMEGGEAAPHSHDSCVHHYCVWWFLCVPLCVVTVCGDLVTGHCKKKITVSCCFTSRFWMTTPPVLNFSCITVRKKLQFLTALLQCCEWLHPRYQISVASLESVKILTVSPAKGR